MLSVPMSTGGGVALELTISEMKFEVIPMIAIIEATSRPLVTLKVAPSMP